MLLMHENSRLFTNDDIRTTTQDNVFRMNMNNMNLDCLENLACTIKPKKYILGFQTKLS